MHTVIFIYEDRVFIVNANSTQKSHPLYEKKNSNKILRTSTTHDEQNISRKIFVPQFSMLFAYVNDV